MISALKKFRPLLLSLIVIFLLFLVVTIIKQLGYKIFYQATLSMPRGFYLLTPNKNLQRNDLVAFTPKTAIEKFLLAKHWLPESGIMIKHVVGIPHDFVCTMQHSIWLNDKPLGPIYRFYAPGKMLPQTHFCAKLNPNEYFLMSTKIARSFDSRYFGPVNIKYIYGKVIPLIITNS